MDYREAGKRYPVFYYHSFGIVESSTELQILFDFEIEGLSHFNPEFLLPKPANAGTIGSRLSFRMAAFSLGMVELISYWKLTCAPQVIVECGSLSPEQIRWWKKLYFNGMGEFFYKNKIPADPETFMNLQSEDVQISGDPSEPAVSGNLIPVGGGKDSLVSLEILKDEYDTNHAFVINQVMSAVHSAQAAGYRGSKLILAQRTLDPRMLDFNKQGYLNGHTPFSALAAFSSMLAAIAWGKQYICLSNEASANEPTVKGSSVNHQYSKTFAFEQDFNDYVRRYITSQIHYFSLLRPLSELQIAGIFSTLPQYFSVFRSCNVGSKEERWCGHCAKCLFVGIMLSAYLDDETIIKIFGRDMLNDESLQDLFEELTGVLDNKPFECVGTREEVNTAVSMSIRAHQQAGRPLPRLYQDYLNSQYGVYYRNRNVDFTAWNSENLLPPQFAAKLKNKMKEMNKR